MIEYKVDDWLEVRPELEKIITAHYEELSVTKEFPLDPDWEVYDFLWKSGKLTFITCKDDGALIGYIIFFVSPHLHLSLIHI